ncbi:hypothetical protein A7U60_g3503 [Sanghuangporus baumii]|uniref:F-box domain-containing protein n=1 Tax=Sanghuangporus baumii TaxID=108892 RepID=A0A9Q5I0C6_SANBA|nr:hypothetical protein A7U60_g3503 [Sanghuangporus baumii]
MSHIRKTFEAPPGPSITFTHLVDDVLVHILCVLSVYDVLRVRETCRHLEAISRSRNVWASLFTRHVLEDRLPVPGFMFVPTPRLSQLLGPHPTDYSLIESSDIEARTLHALRLRKWWTHTYHHAEHQSLNTGDHASGVHHRAFRVSNDVKDIFLLPGGRITVTVHADGLRCWDLGSASILMNNQTRSEALCIGEYSFKRTVASVTVCSDTCVGDHFQYSVVWNLVICDDITPSWNSMENQNRHCEHLTLRVDYLNPALSSKGSSSMFVPSVSFCSRPVFLPDVLPTPISPIPPVSEEFGPQCFGRGKIGELLFVYGTLLFFASYVPTPTSTEATKDDPNCIYAGIEVIDTKAPKKTTLWEYPDSQLGAYVTMHVHAHVNQALVIWQNCAGLYSLPQLSHYQARIRRHRKPLSGISGSNQPFPFQPLPDSTSDPERVRLVMMPEIVFALYEPVEAPVAFSYCDNEALESGKNISDAATNWLPPSLTIIARSCGHTYQTIQSALIASTSNPTYTPSCQSPTHCNGPEASFRLSRIPSANPYAMSVFQPTDAYDVKEGNTVIGLALGASGNGILARADGSLSRCLTADVVLPSYNAYTGELSTTAIKTVDPSSWTRVAELYTDSSIGVDKEGSLTSGGMRTRHPLIRFDDGMGRLVVVRVSSSVSEVDHTDEVVIVDFS